jgi:hypothetical protein
LQSVLVGQMQAQVGVDPQAVGMFLHRHTGGDTEVPG